MGFIKKFISVLICVSLLLHSKSSDGKVFTKCGLTLELIKLNVDRTFVGVCLVEGESFKNTSKISNKGNGIMGLGLFQIKNDQWCSFKNAGGKCNIRCEKLIDDDITDDVQCAKKAFQELGFQAWDGWIRNCKGRPKVTAMPKCPGL